MQGEEGKGMKGLCSHSTLSQPICLPPGRGQQNERGRGKKGLRNHSTLLNPLCKGREGSGI